MNKKKEIQRRYGSNMSDAQYLAVGSALDDLQEHIIDKAWDWFYNMALDYMSGDITDVKWGSMKEDFFKAMED